MTKLVTSISLLTALVAGTALAEVNGEDFNEFPKQDAAHCFGWAAGLDKDQDYAKFIVELSKGRTVSVKEDPYIMEEFGTAMGYSEAMLEFAGKEAADEKYKLICDPIKQSYGF
ncbi:hypothetical protein ITG09_20405 [Vibrio cyclitrophicus]|uniref:hypothetical protein n=1 Tax=Vibrio splendidus TaxID=29497 RepID=UPI002049D3F3|nr:MULTISPECIES: hypothetical protein [Vibrio]UPR36102.1 hypothetical protein ISX50_20270 [Vibrio cyclitrophicus]UPR49696.1 hypothetical protein ITG13_22410 [Vibrio cyclitrophicus]UPR53754.1 hypothetical protein ITG09_20405 [Vibrio cyclitrophicus]UXA00626.1 hypothetical protein IM698_18605 [Vibrio splendidus]